MSHFIDTNKQATQKGLYGLALIIWCMYVALIVGGPVPSTNTRPAGNPRPLLVFPHAADRIDTRETEAMKAFLAIWDSPTQVKRLTAVGDEISPAGDTYFIRYPDGLSHTIKAVPDIRRLFQLAAVSQEYGQIRALYLKVIEMSTDPLIRYRACIGLARAAFRTRGPQALEDRQVYTRLALKSPVTGPCQSDAHYLKAMGLVDDGHRLPALDELELALELDPCFLDAHWAVIRLTSGLLDDPGTKESALRLRLLTGLLSSLERSVNLTKNKGDFHQMGDELQHGVTRSSEVSFAAGYCYYQTGEFEQAQRCLKRFLQVDGMSGSCRNEARKRAVILLNAMTMVKDREV